MNQHSPLEHYRDEIGRCVKCGACRTVCPTFLAERQESLSPRGRMALVKAVLDTRLPVSKIYKDRLATCTTCLACEAACPGNVPVTEILQAAREQAVLASGVDIISTALSGVIKHAALFQAAAWLAPIVLHYKKGPASRVKHRDESSTFTIQSSKSRRSKGTIGFFPGCAVEHFQPEIGRATMRVLRAIGYEVLVPRDLKCCGRPLLSLGDARAAAELAEHNASVFAALRVDAIVTACASCGLTFKREYPKLLRPGVKGPSVLDIHEFLSHALIGAVFKPVHKTITWHDPCHLGRGQGLSRTARNILGVLPGLTFVEMRNADQCCGFVGVMRITHPSLSNSIAGEKIRNIAMSGASTVATGCPGCRMQIGEALRRAGSDVTAVHTVQLLEEALSNVEREARSMEFQMTGSVDDQQRSGIT
jgi:glycolate oxidase iron-sulfur subunit